MDLLIDTYGTFIGSTGERLVLKLPSKSNRDKRIVKEYPIHRINKIVILRPSSISMHAVKLALEHEVDIVYLGSFGKPVGRIFSSDSKDLATTRRAQLEVSNDPAKALALAKSFITGKCRNQITYMRYLMAKYGADFEKAITQAETLLKTIESIRPGTGARDQLLGVEVFIGGIKPGIGGRGALGKVLALAAVEDKGKAGFGRARITVIPDASARSLKKAIDAMVEPGSKVRTDEWKGYTPAALDGYHHTVMKRQSREPGEDPTPLVHRIAALLKRARTVPHDTR